MEEIKEQLAYRETNQEKVAAFRVTRTLGEGMKVLLDEDDGRFMVTSARNWQEANPDVLSFSDVTGCKLDIDESKTEIQYKDAEGKRQSFSPRRYAFSYDFYIVSNVNLSLIHIFFLRSLNQGESFAAQFLQQFPSSSFRLRCV